MKRPLLPFVVCLVLSSALSAGSALPGVVVEWAESESTPEGEQSAVSVLYAQGEMLRMEPRDENGDEMAMIFRGDEMLFVDAAKNECQRIDEEGVAALSQQMSGMMAEMEKQLAQLPPEQRKMAEQMMKGRMPAGMGQKAPPRRIEKGGSESVAGRSCVIHTGYVGDAKSWEACVAKPKNSAAYGQMMQAFEALGEFTTKLRESAMQGPFNAMFENAFSDMAKLEGEPVRMRSYSGGQLISEEYLKSISEKELDAALFEAPAGCKVTDMTDQIRR